MYEVNSDQEADIFTFLGQDVELSDTSSMDIGILNSQATKTMT